MKDKANTNDLKLKMISFDEWIKTLELKEVEVDCDVCNGEGSYDCDVCDGEGTVKCEECDDGEVDCEQCNGSCSIDCDACNGDGTVECDSAGDLECEDKDCEACEFSQCEECEGTGSMECDSCDGTGVQECGVSGCDSGKIKCEEDGCEDGQIKCGDCGGDGSVIEYAPKDLEHLEELQDLGICLFWSDGDTCDYSDLKAEYSGGMVEEVKLIRDRLLDNPGDPALLKWLSVCEEEMGVDAK